MKLKFLLLFLILIISGCTNIPNKVYKWEYKVVQLAPFENGLTSLKVADINKSVLESQRKLLKENGKEGWELVDVSNVNYIFKRPALE